MWTNTVFFFFFFFISNGWHFKLVTRQISEVLGVGIEPNQRVYGVKNARTAYLP